MEDCYIVIMEKNKSTGILERELTACNLGDYTTLVMNIYAIENDSQLDLHMKITTDRDLLDWEFAAVYDYYDGEIFKDQAKFSEVDDCENPTWELVFPYIEDETLLEQKINSLLKTHRSELDDVYAAVSGLEAEYSSKEDNNAL